jgi:hypothetical protein
MASFDQIGRQQDQPNLAYSEAVAWEKKAKQSEIGSLCWKDVELTITIKGPPRKKEYKLSDISEATLITHSCTVQLGSALNGTDRDSRGVDRDRHNPLIRPELCMPRYALAVYCMLFGQSLKSSNDFVTSTSIRGFATIVESSRAFF